MRHYDQYGRRIPSSREDASRPTILSVLFIAILLLMALGFGARYVELNKWQEYRTSQTRLTAHDSMCAITTEQGVTIRLYVMIDPDTGAQYVVSDRGGVCPRTEVDDG